MPGLNRKGPNGEGAMTGRRMGKCNPDNKEKTDEEIVEQNVNTSSKQDSESTFGNGGRRRFFGLFGKRQGQGQGRGQGRGRGQGQGNGQGQKNQ